MKDPPQYQDDLRRQIAKKELRKLRSRRNEDRSIWFGLGMFGLVGWSIAIPTVIGVALGIWLDRNWPQPFSFTLMCLFAGVVTGCLIAWYWVKRESQATEESENGSANESPAKQ